MSGILGSLDQRPNPGKGGPLVGLRANTWEGDERHRRIWRLANRMLTAVKAIGFEMDNAWSLPVIGGVRAGSGAPDFVDAHG